MKTPHHENTSRILTIHNHKLLKTRYYQEHSRGADDVVASAIVTLTFKP